MTDHSAMKLGKLAARHDARAPMLSKFTAALPPAPASIIWSGKLARLGVMLNDQIGDCTCAAAGHLVQAWTSLTRDQQAIVPDADIVAFYEGACGYDPKDPSSDRGGVESDVLDYWMKHPLAGHALDGICAIELKNHADVMDAIWLFGGAYIGLDLPKSAQSQDVWTVPFYGSSFADGKPGSWGGHAVCVLDYDARGLTCVTWGALKRMTWGFWDAYCDEAYALLSKDWVAANGAAPSGFAWEALDADLTAFRAA